MKLFMVFYLAGVVTWVSEPIVEMDKTACENAGQVLLERVDPQAVTKDGHTKDELEVECVFGVNPPEFGSVKEGYDGSL